MTAESPVRDAIASEMWLATRLPFGPLGVGLAIAGLLIGIGFALRLALDLPWWERSASGQATLTGSTRVTIVLSLLIGYVMAVARHATVSQYRDLQSMGLADPDVDPERVSIRGTMTQLRASRRAGALGLLAAAAVALWFGWREAGGLGAGLVGGLDGIRGWSFGDTWIFVLGSILMWLVARAIYFNLRGNDAFETPSTGDIEIDLLDTRRLHPFGRLGVRSALYWLVGISIGSPLLVDPALSPTDRLVFIPLFGVSLVVAILALLLPVRGIQRRIRRAKEDELARIDAAIGGDDDALRATRVGSRRPAPGLADLIAYRGYVEEVREWPFDGSAWVRFLLFSAIPVGSWVAAAFVERGITALLD